MIIFYNILALLFLFVADIGLGIAGFGHRCAKYFNQKALNS